MLTDTAQTLPPQPRKPFRLGDMRWGSERRWFWFTILIFALGIFVFTTISLGTLFVILLGVFALAWFLMRLLHAGMLGSAVKVTSAQMPSLAKLFEECARRVQPPLVQGFVAQSPLLNAYAFGFSSPQAIVLYSGLVEHLDEDELRFVIGHEMGHVAFGHTRVNSTIGGLAGVPGIPFISEIISVAFLAWSRCAEFSSDRAGLIACGRLDKAQSAMVKLMIGPKLASMISVAELEKQADDLSFNPLGWLGQLGQRHPFSVFRLREQRKFAESEAYRNTIESLEEI